MSSFYTYVGQYGGKLFVRGFKNGREQTFKTSFCPSLFIKSKKKDAEWRSIYDEPLDEIKFSDIGDAKDFVQRYKEVSNFEIHGMQNYQYQYIAQEYPGEIQYSLLDMDIQTLDIETATEDGFPDIQTANQEVLLITMYDKHRRKAITFGTRSWDQNRIREDAKEELSDHEIEYRVFRDEYTMLKAFVDHWSTNYPTIVTGWNTSQFDFPYLVNRINRILSEDDVKRLSPFGIVSSREVEIYGKKVQLFDIVGIIEADYLELYKKYTYSSQESYSLEYIATQELGVGKLDYDGSFKDFYSGTYEVTNEDDSKKSNFNAASYKRYCIKQELIKRGLSVPK